MKFSEFIEIQASLLPAINFAPGSTAFYDIIRLWNAMAIMNPDKCEDLVVWEKGSPLSTMVNDIDLNEIRIALSTKKLENLPDNLRTNYNPHTNTKPEPPKPPQARTPEPSEPEKTEPQDSESKAKPDPEPKPKNKGKNKNRQNRHHDQEPKEEDIDAMADAILGDDPESDKDIHVPDHVKADSNEKSGKVEV